MISTGGRSVLAAIQGRSLQVERRFATAALSAEERMKAVDKLGRNGPFTWKEVGLVRHAVKF
jgi:hypothetical protein